MISRNINDKIKENIHSMRYRVMIPSDHSIMLGQYIIANKHLNGFNESDIVYESYDITLRVKDIVLINYVYKSWQMVTKNIYFRIDYTFYGLAGRGRDVSIGNILSSNQFSNHLCNDIGRVDNRVFEILRANRMKIIWLRIII